MIVRLDELADALLAQATDQIGRMRTRGRASRVRAFMVGDAPACARTAVTWGSLAKRCGAELTVHALPSSASAPDIDARLDAVATDPDITGVCFLPPFPAQHDLLRLVRRLPMEKDILGLHPQHVGLALGGAESLSMPMAQAVVAALTTAHIDLFGKSVLLAGDAHTLTIPLAAALAVRCARITLVSPDAPDLAALALAHDVLVVEGLAAGAVAAVKDGAVAFDLSARGPGSDSLAGGAFGAEVLDQASAVLPAGGIEPLRDAFVIQNIMECARMQETRFPGGTPTWKGNPRK